MKILFLDWGCFGKAYAVITLTQLGHEVIMFSHKDYQERISSDFAAAFHVFVEEHPVDLCFSFNYYAVLSEAAKLHNLKYVSIIYDSPYVMLYSYTLINPNNYVFLFDSNDYFKLKSAGISTVYYLPLAVNATIIDTLLKKDYDNERLSAEVSFVGSLYNEDHNFFSKLKGISDYTRGYLDGIMKAQLKISGYNFIEEVITKDITTDLQNIIHYTTSNQGVETLEYIFANYFINRKLTEMERYTLLKAVAGQFKLKLFTLNPAAEIPNALNMGVADYFSEMPYVFYNSKINLNITLRSIKSGIPLRCMDILGAGGFLLTNFQSDLLNHFEPEKDFVYYEDEDDLIRKIDYYLEHDEKRKEIAENGHEKVKENHSFEKTFTQILEIVESKNAF